MKNPVSSSLLAPAYIRIKNSLHASIKSGELRPGDKLPSENELSLAHNASRITIRLALKELQTQGLIYSWQGKGTFVSQPAMGNISGIRSFSADARSKGLTPSSIILRSGEALPSPTVAEHLNIQQNEPIYILHRVRLLNDVPVVVEHAHLPLSLFPGFGQHDLSDSIFDIFEESYHITPAWTDNQIQSVLADGELAAQLRVQPNEPLLKIHCTDYTETFKVIEYVVSFYIGRAHTFATGRQSII